MNFLAVFEGLKSLAVASAAPMSSRTGEPTVPALSVREDAREAGLRSEGFQSLGRKSLEWKSSDRFGKKAQDIIFR
jgi:hypothetical protein